MAPLNSKKIISDIVQGMRGDFQKCSIPKQKLIDSASNAKTGIVSILSTGISGEMTPEFMMAVVYGGSTHKSRLSATVVLRLFNYSAGVILAAYEREEHLKIVNLQVTHSLLVLLGFFNNGEQDLDPHVARLGDDDETKLITLYCHLWIQGRKLQNTDLIESVTTKVQDIRKLDVASVVSLCGCVFSRPSLIPALQLAEQPLRQYLSHKLLQYCDNIENLDDPSCSLLFPNIELVCKVFAG